jgi:hypothetical protein
MIRQIRLLAAGALFLSLLPSALRAQFANPDLQSRKKVVHTVLILPGQANVAKSGVKGNEPMVEESRALGAGLTSEVTNFMTGVGCTVPPNSFSDESLDHNPDLKYALADLQDRFDKVWVQVAKKPKDIRTGRYTMGDEVANFSLQRRPTLSCLYGARKRFLRAGKNFWALWQAPMSQARP